MDKKTAQMKAIRSKKDAAEEEGEYDREGGKKHGKADAIRDKKDEKEEKGKFDKEGVVKRINKR